MAYKLYHFMFLAALLLAALATSAQKEEIRPLSAPVLLGSHAAVLTGLAAKNRGDQLQLTVPGRLLSGKVNAVNQLPGDGIKETIGRIEGEPASSFWYRTSAQATNGAIWLPQSRKAYRIYTQAGQDFIVAVAVDDVACVDYAAPVAATETPTGTGPAPTGNAVAAELNLQSKPDAPTCVKLDFDGEVISGTWWYGGNTVTANPSPMYTNDNQMAEVYRIVVEKYITCNVNVTTSETVFQSYPVNKRVKCVFTDGALSNGNGGIAYVNSFGQGQPCFVYISGRNGALAGVHEIGHTLNLIHDGGQRVNADGTVTTWAYSSGFDNWGPNMGTGYGRAVVQWCKGDYLYANNLQPDFNYFRRRLTLKNDDHGNGLATATTVLQEGNGQILRSRNFGIINNQTDSTAEDPIYIRKDKDFFRYTTAGERIRWTFYPASDDPCLKIQVRIFNSNSTLRSSFTSPMDLKAVVDEVLPAGQYFFEVSGVGRGNPFVAPETGYTDYGSVGTYSFESFVDTLRAWNATEVWRRYLPNSANTINADMMNPATGICYFNDTIIPRTIGGYVNATAILNGSQTIGYSSTTSTWNVNGGYRFYIPRTDAGTAKVAAYSTPAFVYNRNVSSLALYQGPESIPNKFSHYGLVAGRTASLEFFITFTNDPATAGAAATYICSFGSNTAAGFATATGSSLDAATQAGIFQSLAWQVNDTGRIVVKHRTATAANSLADFTDLPLAGGFRFQKNNAYKVKLYANNTSQPQYYKVDGTEYMVAPQRYDLWVNDTVLLADEVQNLRALTGNGLVLNENIGDFAFESGSLNASPAEYAVLSGIYAKHVSTNTAPTTQILPLTWKSFTAVWQNEQALLTWQTTDEQQTRHFEIERSSDGRRFKLIGSRPAGNNGRTANVYQHTDPSPATGANYYRIRQVDVDGKSTYSGIVLLQSGKSGLYKVYPTYVQGQQTQVYFSRSATAVQLLLTDASGKAVRRKMLGPVSAGQVVAISTQHVASGVYFLQITDGQNRETVKLVVE